MDTSTAPAGENGVEVCQACPRDTPKPATDIIYKTLQTVPYQEYPGAAIWPFTEDAELHVCADCYDSLIDNEGYSA